jgi:hypothetical protein
VAFRRARKSRLQSFLQDEAVAAFDVNQRGLPHRKLCQTVAIIQACSLLVFRQQGWHALLLSQKLAVTRLALFLDLQEHIQAVLGERSFEIYLPISRSAIAEYIGLSRQD